MIKTFIMIGFLSFGIVSNIYAEGTDRINQLEKEVQELKLRISKLESLMSDSSEPKELAPSHEGWKSVSNWRKLSTGMGYHDVEKILGAPQRVNGGVYAAWYYPNGGEVGFYRGKVDSWSEPRE